jgi:hypothetical protein
VFKRKGKKLRGVFLNSLILIEVLVFSLTPFPQETAESDVQTERPLFNVPETSMPVTIDGILNEPAWDMAIILQLPYEIDPGENLPARVKTECLLISDQHNLYVGFRAYDPNPHKIRAHYMDRDSAFDDDWVFITLDPFQDERRGFQFLANPLGVQMDTLLNEVGSGGSDVDVTWDAIWDSSGRITQIGYEVEMSIPFTSLRFPKSDRYQQWGFQALRHYPRKFSYFFRLTPWNRNRDCTLCENATIVGFQRANQGRNLEFNPTLTAHKTDTAPTFPATSLNTGRAKAEPGLSLRWGITPDIQLNSTLNPDFSHVEADVAQLEINTRFTLYYVEKRPFFLEGSDIFKTQINAVYTRTITDPLWGFKLSGKKGRHAFGILASQDMLTNILLPSNLASQLISLDQRALSSILRYRMDVGRQSTLGALASNRQGHAYSNSVLGCDGQLQLTPTDSIGFQFALSKTSYPQEVSHKYNQPYGSFSSGALSLYCNHEARDWNWWITYENLGRGFRADLGFVPRVDFRSTTAGIRRIFWEKPDGWYRKLLFTVEGNTTDNQEGQLTDRHFTLMTEINGPLQSILSFSIVAKREFYMESYFDQEFFQLSSSIRPSASLAFMLTGKIGDGVDYAGMRSAKVLRITPGIGFFIGRTIQASLEHSLERLHMEAGSLYVANLSQVRLVYQPTVRTFVRAIFQYLDLDLNLEHYPSEPAPIKRKLLTQLLFSYKINPQTLVFLGYSENRFGMEGIVFFQHDRTFFIKISYAWLY